MTPQARVNILAHLKTRIIMAIMAHSRLTLQAAARRKATRNVSIRGTLMVKHAARSATSSDHSVHKVSQSNLDLINE